MTALVEDYPEDYQTLNNLAWVYATSKMAPIAMRKSHRPRPASLGPVL